MSERFKDGEMFKERGEGEENRHFVLLFIQARKVKWMFEGQQEDNERRETDRMGERRSRGKDREKSIEK